MKRLLIIGNGFDIAHNLPTRYSDFLEYYWQTVSNAGNYDDRLVFLKSKIPLKECKSLADLHYEIKDINSYQVYEMSKIQFSFKNNFFKALCERQDNCNWVDIEMFYYNYLKQCHNNPEAVELLNNEFADFIEIFDNYILEVVNNLHLAEQVSNPLIEKIFSPKTFSKDEFSEYLKTFPVKKRGIVLRDTKQYERGTRVINDIHILNFNYTDTVKKLYSKQIEKNIGKIINHIHGVAGSCDLPMVFGFGDETDEHFREMEKTNDNLYLKYMKSSAYLRNDNYFRLFNFLDSGSYIVEILGHSLALSDRTLLKAILEHENCLHVKIHYWKRKDKNNFETDNFEELSINISRHFNDKIMMRERVANKVFCTHLPQFFE